MKVKSDSEVAQLCPTLSDPMDCNLPGFSVHGIFRQEYWSELTFPSPNNFLTTCLIQDLQANKNYLQKLRAKARPFLGKINPVGSVHPYLLLCCSQSLSHIQLFATPWTAAYQAPPSMGSARQEYWSGLPLLSLSINIDHWNIYFNMLK